MEIAIVGLPRRTADDFSSRGRRKIQLTCDTPADSKLAISRRMAQVELQRERLEPAQRAERFGLLIELVLQAPGQCGIMEVFDVAEFKVHD